MKGPFSLLFALCLGLPAVPTLLAEPVMQGTVLRTLPNGLRLIVREQRGAALVALDIWVRAGSVYEGPEESGAAHFIEHLLFKGTPTRGPGEIDAAIEDLGATLNAGTTRDAAHFYTTVAAPYLETALAVLADALQNAAIAPEEMERERAVILDEMARGQNDRRKQALNHLYERLYGRHPYGRPILGRPDSLKRMSRDTVVGFYRRLYAPNNTTVVLVGDITPDAAQTAVEKAFGGWAKRAVPPPPAVEGMEVEEETRKPGDKSALRGNPALLDSLSPSASLSMGFRVTSGDNAAEVCTADVLTALLGDERTGRLAKALTPGRLATEATADYATLRGPGVFALCAATEPTDVERVRQAFAAEMERLRTRPVSVDELEIAKRRVLGAYLFDIETYAGQARMLGLYDTIHDYRFAMDYVDNIRKVTAKDIQAFAQRYFDPSRRAEVVLVLPSAE